MAMSSKYETAEGMAAAKWVSDNPPEMDPVRGDNGYPSTIEEFRIASWCDTRRFVPDDLLALMDYVKVRWSYPEFWKEEDVEDFGPHRQYTLVTGGWSGNEQLISALEDNQTFAMLAPYSWERGGRYVYRIRHAAPKA